MRRISIVRGTRIIRNGTIYVLETRFEDETGVERWEVLDESTQLHDRFSREEILEAIGEGTQGLRRTKPWTPRRKTLAATAATLLLAKGSDVEDGPSGLDDATASDAGMDQVAEGVRVLGDASEEHASERGRRIAQTIRFKRLLVAKVSSRTTSGWLRDKSTGGVAETIVRDACVEVSRVVLGEEAPPRIVGLRQYQRYARQVGSAETIDDLADRMSDRGRREGRWSGVRELVLGVMNAQLSDVEKARARGEKRRLTVRQVQEAVTAAIKKKALESPDVNIKPIGYTTFYKYWNLFLQSRRQAALCGPLSVSHDYRRPGIPDHARFPLEVCQFDETQLRIVVIHHVYGVVLGKPQLAWIADTFSGGICGFFLGFDPPSDLVTGQTLRHACVPKTYVRRVYPGIANDWLYGGIPKTLLFDNSLTGRSRSITAITGELDILHDFQPSRMPWLKGLVENTFGVVERTLLEDLDGFTPAPGTLPLFDYDPRGTAVIGLDRLLAILHAWICDQFHVRRPTTGQEVPPNVLWEEGRRIAEPDFLARDTDLDALFGLMRRARRVASRGFVYQDIHYYSDALHRMRLDRGAVGTLDIRVNPLDLSVAYFRGHDGCWYPAAARERKGRGTESLTGMTEHLWKILGRRASELYGARTLERRFDAAASVRELVAQGMGDGMTFRGGERLARAFGISSAPAFRLIGPTGELADTVADPSPVAVPAEVEKPRLPAPAPALPAALPFDFSLEEQK